MELKRTTWLSKTQIVKINRALKKAGLTPLTGDTGKNTGAYLINALERIPVQERKEVLAIIANM